MTENAGFHFIQPRLNQLWEILQREIAPETPVYLVGGALRDLLSGRAVHDLDLVIEGRVRPAARRIADLIGGDFYVMDDQRDTIRVIDRAGEDGPVDLDFCALRAVDLETDLRERDFTVNAMALELHHPTDLIDPTGGAADLRAGVLRACSPLAFEKDPIRVLRGVRLVLQLGFRIEPATLGWMRAAAAGLPGISAERRRDELFRMFESSHAPAALRLVDAVGALGQVMPELVEMKAVTQSPPHTLDVWEHTLAVLTQLERMWMVLAAPSAGEAGMNLWEGMALERLGRFRPALRDHFAASLNPNRSLRGLIFFAALYHDAAKPATRSVEANGRVRFLRHEEQGADLVGQRAHRLALSQVETQRAHKIVRHHMRVHLLAAESHPPSRRAIYRFFRDAGAAGVDVALLSLADTLATYGATLTPEVWQAELNIVAALLEAWFDQPTQSVNPSRLLSGSELIEELGIEPGPRVGQLLEALREAQAGGQVNSRAEALEFLRAAL